MKTYAVQLIDIGKEVFLMSTTDDDQFLFNTLGGEYQEKIPTTDFISALIIQRDIMLIPEITKIQEKAKAIKVSFATNYGSMLLSFPFGREKELYRIARYFTVLFSNKGSTVVIKDGLTLSSFEAAAMILAVGLNAFPETPDPCMQKFSSAIRLPQYNEEKRDLRCRSTVILEELELVRKEFATGGLWKSLKPTE